jgi:hypothetical protein
MITSGWKCKIKFERGYPVTRCGLHIGCTRFRRCWITAIHLKPNLKTTGLFARTFQFFCQPSLDQGLVRHVAFIGSHFDTLQ